MKIVFFCLSIRSDWNNPSAHFLRGVATELVCRGHRVRFLEPEMSTCLSQMVAAHGWDPVVELHRRHPMLHVEPYNLDLLDPDRELKDADLVVVHESCSRELIRRIVDHRKCCGRYQLLFHDTHRRALTAPERMRKHDLSGFDGALVSGDVLRRTYLRRGHCARAFVWSEAADIRHFHPQRCAGEKRDLVWLGNAEDDERLASMRELFIEPVTRLGLSASAYGAVYSEEARRELEQAGIPYRGWVPNYRVPEVLAAHRIAIDLPRACSPYRLPGIAGIRMFEALACGIPLVSGEWRDIERLFHAGLDFLTAKNGRQMERHLSQLMTAPELGRRISERGLATIRSRHTCMHRAEQLLAIHRELTSIPELRAALVS